MANINDSYMVENGLSLDDVVGVFQGTDDPTSGGGEAAPVGSLFLRTNGQAWQKIGVGNTAWTQLAAGSGVVNINDLGDVTVTAPTTGQVLVYNTVGGVWENVDNPATAGFTVMKEPTGFPNRDDSRLTINEGTRTVTIEPIGADFKYHIWGVEYTISAPVNGIFPDTQGMHFFYLDTAGVMQVQTGGFLPTLLSDFAYVANVYWDVGSQTATVFGEERHGLTMDHATHLHFHTTLGTQYVSGLALNSLVVDGTGALDTEAQFGVDNGLCRDEDIDLNYVHNATGADNDTADLEQILNNPSQLPILYRDGPNGDWKKKTADTFPIIYSGTAGYVDGANGLPAWNEWTGVTWQLSPVTNNNFVLVHIIATNDMRHPIIGIQGSVNYQNKPQGTEAANIELAGLAGLPFQEFSPIATVIYECRTAWSNTPLAIIRSTDEGDDYVDWRDVDTFSSVLGGGGLTEHGNLGGLADDDHLQYALAGSGSTRTFDAGDLTDVTITGLTADELLFTQDGVTWINQTLAEADIASATDLTNHTGDATIHFTEGSIDHTNITNIGINSHAAIDTHIADATIHYTMASISITESQISDFGTYASQTEVDNIEASMGLNLMETDGTFDAVNMNLLNNVSGALNLYEVLADFDAAITAAAGVDTLPELTDVTITALGADELLFTQDGVTWINQTLSEADIASATDLTNHTGDATIHFTEASIDHTAISNIGINSHATIDTHIADGTIHTVDQNLWETITSDAGSAVANTTTDTLTISGGTGISTAITGDTLTITNDSPNVVQNAFTNIAVATQNTVVADTSTDTLTLVAGTNITITTNDVTDTITISAAGSVGESNTASNQGTAGVGVFIQKTGVDLEFKNVNAGSNKISITDDVANNEIDIDVNEANLTITESQISDLGTYATQTEVDNIEASMGLNLMETDGTFDVVNMNLLNNVTGAFNLYEVLEDFDAAITAAATDDLVKVSAADTTSGYLNDTLVDGDGITKTINNPAADETLTLAITQTTVTGNPSPANDQDMMVLADASRAGKLLSVETDLYHFSEAAISPLEWIQIGVASDALTGIVMPFNGTVVRAVGHCSDANGNTKDIDLYIGAVNTATLGTFSGAGESSFANTTLNVDVAAGDKIRLRGGNQAGNIADTIITLYIKWRA